VIDERLGAAELDALAETLLAPWQLGEYLLEGLISRTSTALIFVARGGVFGAAEGVLKLTGEQYAPLLERELSLLNRCQDAEVHGVVRPVRPTLEWIEPEDGDQRVAAMALPFLAGGDLVQFIGSRRQIGSALALRVGELVGGSLRSLLGLPKPLVHGDVKPQNVLLPYHGAKLEELQLIDFDASEELEIDLDQLSAAPREVAQRLINDVNGFGELLYILATGSDPPVEAEPDLATGNTAFDWLVRRCLSSEVFGTGYVCLADNGLWRDLETALSFERRRRRPNLDKSVILSRVALCVIAIVILCALVIALVSKFLFA
jgi:hypothetical protein